MQKPFPAYQGQAPYSFICYAHDDTSRVYRDIGWLDEQGINIWYDEGISPGVEWSEELGRALEGAKRLVFFVSESSIASRHCRDEVHFALNHDIPVLTVFLEDVALPVGLELAIGSTQAVLAYDLSAQNYRERLLASMSADAEQHGSEWDAKLNRRLQTKRRRVRRRWAIWLSCATLVVIAGVVLFKRYQPAIMAEAILAMPLLFNSATEQQIGFATTSDGQRIAYATTGSGEPLLVVLGWGTHLERGMMSPMYDGQGVLAMTSQDHRVVRYDGRGFGMSDRDVTDWSLQGRVRDIEAVADAANLERFTIYAQSAGGPAAIIFAAENPERVSSLVLASTYCSVSASDVQRLQSFESVLDLFERDWDTNPLMANLMVDYIDPSVPDTVRRVMSELFRRAGNGASMANFFRTYISVEVCDRAAELKMPVYVMHGREDAAIPLEAGRMLASVIPQVEFEIVEGNHGPGTGNTPEARQMILDWLEQQPR